MSGGLSSNTSFLSLLTPSPPPPTITPPLPPLPPPPPSLLFLLPPSSPPPPPLPPPQGTLNVYHLNQSDLCLVNNDGMTLLMVAVLHNQVDLVRQLIAKTPCPLNYKQIKVCL